MEGQFNKIKKFKGVLLALMVAVAASIPVTTGEFKDVYAEMVVPKNQKYKRHYGYRDKEGYFFVSKGDNFPTLLRYTLKTLANNQVVCSFEVYTEVTVTKENQQNRSYRCWLSLLNLQLAQRNIACVSAGAAACYHPNDKTIDEVYGMIETLNAIYRDAYGCGLNFKAVGVSQGESVYTQDGYVVNGDFVTSLLRQNSDQSRPCERAWPAVNRNQYQQQQQQQPAANPVPFNQINQNRQRSPYFNQVSVQQQYPFNQLNQQRQLPRPYQSPLVNQRQRRQHPFNQNQGQHNNPENLIGSFLGSRKYQGYRYQLKDIRGPGSFGTVYGATLFDPYGKPSGEYCIKILKSDHVKVDDYNGNVSCSCGDSKTTQNIQKEIRMMKKVLGRYGTNQFIEAFNQSCTDQSGPRNVCIVQSDCGRPFKSPAGEQTDFANTADIMGQILFITKNAHNRGVIHGDIKPANVMIKENGLVSLINFGVAREINTAICSPYYMAPEVLEKVLTSHSRQSFEWREKADTWSIGCLFYKLLTGNVPFSGDSKQEIYNNLCNFQPYWNQFNKDVRRNFRVNGIVISDFQIGTIRNFVSTLLNINASIRPDMTTCIRSFIWLCSTLNINLRHGLMDSLRSIAEGAQF